MSQDSNINILVGMSKRTKVYYAHPMAYYHSELARKDITSIRALGLDVINPSDPQYRAYSMDQFVELALSCDAIFFRAYRGGKVGSGVAKEVAAMHRAGKPVFELTYVNQQRTLLRGETRARNARIALGRATENEGILREIGGLDYHDEDWGHDKTC